jgi:hypothetical protein
MPLRKSGFCRFDYSHTSKNPTGGMCALAVSFAPGGGIRHQRECQFGVMPALHRPGRFFISSLGISFICLYFVAAKLDSKFISHNSASCEAVFLIILVADKITSL